MLAEERNDKYNCNSVSTSPGHGHCDADADGYGGLSCHFLSSDWPMAHNSGILLADTDTDSSTGLSMNVNASF